MPPCCLPPDLPRDYAAIVFFANSRFETGKKKLQFLTFEDFAFCAEQMIQNWTLGAVGELGALRLNNPLMRTLATLKTSWLRGGFEPPLRASLPCSDMLTRKQALKIGEELLHARGKREIPLGTQEKY